MYAWGKKRKLLVFTAVYVCVKAKLTLVRFFFFNFFFCTFPLWESRQKLFKGSPFCVFCKANTKWQIQKSANLPGKSALKEIYQDVTKCLHIVPSRLFCNKIINRSGIYDFCSIWPDAANLIAIPGKFFKKLKCRSGRNGVSGCIMAEAASSAKAAVGNSSVCVECNSPLIHPSNKSSHHCSLNPY